VKTMLIMVVVSAFLILGCARFDRAYLGSHGPSIQLHPDIHVDASKDQECLTCHHPDSAQGTPSPHPKFKGCLKCHNDPVL